MQPAVEADGDDQEEADQNGAGRSTSQARREQKRTAGGRALAIVEPRAWLWVRQLKNGQKRVESLVDARVENAVVDAVFVVVVAVVGVLVPIVGADAAFTPLQLLHLADISASLFTHRRRRRELLMCSLCPPPAAGALATVASSSRTQRLSGGAP